MARQQKSPILDELRKATVDERRAVEFLERHRWGADPACPRCGDLDVYMMKTRDGERNKDYRWRCRGCKRMYTVRTGTVFEESRLPLRVWVYAFWKACSSKKGISALQLSREMEITHKSALFVLRRIRYGLGDGPDARKLSGTVEVDETFIGGKPRHKGTSKRGRGTKKTPVLGIVERAATRRSSTQPASTSGRGPTFTRTRSRASSRSSSGASPARSTRSARSTCRTTSTSSPSATAPGWSTTASGSTQPSGASTGSVWTIGSLLTRRPGPPSLPHRQPSGRMPAWQPISALAK